MKLKSELITLLIRFSTILIGFLSSILTARFLGVEGRGDYFFVTTLTLLLTQFASLGLSSSNTYYVANNTQLLDRLVTNSFWVSVISGFCFSLFAYILFSYFDISLPRGTWAILCLVPSSIFYLLGVNLLVGINKINAYNAFQLFSNIQVVALIVIAGLMKSDVYGFLMASMLGWLAIALVLFIRLKKHANSYIFSLRFDRENFMQTIPYGLKAYITTLIGMLVLKGNVLILRFYFDEEVLGYYSIASQLNDCIGVLPATIGLLLFPSLVRNKDRKWQEMKNHFYRIVILMIMVCIVAAFAITPFIKIAYGDSFLPAVSVFWWILPAAFFLGGITIFSQFLAAIGFPFQLIGAWGIALMVMLFSSFWLVPKYAAHGAAMSLSLTYAVMFILIATIVFRYKK